VVAALRGGGEMGINAMSVGGYSEFLERKTHHGAGTGSAPIGLPSAMFAFQRDLAEWAIWRGRAAVFADCGLGKTLIQLSWADNMRQHAGGRALVVTPLAVGAQTVQEGHKFGIACERSADGRPARGAPITVTNYERLHLFNRDDYSAVVCDESSAIKSFNGKRRAVVTDFLRDMPYRLLCTATAAPNDYTELGTSSEALGVMGYMDMLSRYFRNQNNNAVDTRGHWSGFHAPRDFVQKQWRFKHHAETPFWRWMCSWARAVRKPSDLGYPDDGFDLPSLNQVEHVVATSKTLPGELFARPAMSLAEQRAERRMTIPERVSAVAEIVAEKPGRPFVVWCHLNEEGDAIERAVPDAVQVAGKDADEVKEERFAAFASGDIRVLVTKPKIGAWGLNWQHCADVVVFPSHSFEQYYQSVRRCWRFGQSREVTVHVVATEGEAGVLGNLKSKSEAADRMFEALTSHMNDPLYESGPSTRPTATEVPSWL